MDDLGSPQETDLFPDSPPKRRISSIVGKLDIDSYDQTITREEYYKQRASRDSESLHSVRSDLLSKGSV